MEEFKCKYKYRDNVFVMEGNAVVECVVSKINIDYGSKYLRDELVCLKIVYDLIVCGSTLTSESSVIKRNELEVFATKEDLIKSL